jgi:hypothetical protein
LDLSDETSDSHRALVLLEGRLPLFTGCVEGEFCELRHDGVLGSSHRAAVAVIMLAMERGTTRRGKRGKEKSAMKIRRAKQVEQSPFGAQVAFKRATIGAMALGALAVGATAIGALAIGALAIRALIVKRSRIQRLQIEELDVGRLHVRELVVEEEQRPVVEQEQTPPPQASE